MPDSFSYDDTAQTLDVDGVKIHYHEAGSGPVTILLHGAGPGVSGWGNFAANLPVFAEHHRTLIIDQPGFGSSDRPDFDGDYFSFSARTVLGVMDLLEIERANFVGNSLGGGVAARFALDHPSRADRLALMGPGGFTARLFIPEPTVGHERLYAFYENGETREALATFMRGMMFDPNLVTDEMIDDRFRRSQESGSGEFFKKFAASFRQPENLESTQLWRYAAQIEHETALIWGREDLVNPYDGALFGFAQMPNASLHIISRCGHWAQTERFDEFNNICLNLFAPGR